jgi:hypothetical protein
MITMLIILITNQHHQHKEIISSYSVKRNLMCNFMFLFWRSQRRSIWNKSFLDSNILFNVVCVSYLLPFSSSVLLQTIIKDLITTNSKFSCKEICFENKIFTCLMEISVCIDNISTLWRWLLIGGLRSLREDSSGKNDLRVVMNILTREKQQISKFFKGSEILQSGQVTSKSFKTLQRRVARCEREYHIYVSPLY